MILKKKKKGRLYILVERSYDWWRGNLYSKLCWKFILFLKGYKKGFFFP